MYVQGVYVYKYMCIYIYCLYINLNIHIYIYIYIRINRHLLLTQWNRGSWVHGLPELAAGNPEVPRTSLSLARSLLGWKPA